MNVKSRRIALKKTQEEVALDMEMGISTYRRIEQGIANPELNTLSKIARYFKTDLGTLWMETHSISEECTQQTDDRTMQILGKVNRIKNREKRNEVRAIIERIIDLEVE
jgi:transcriptional regulator with XRE-family HTH domain